MYKDRIPDSGSILTACVLRRKAPNRDRKASNRRILACREETRVHTFPCCFEHGNYSSLQNIAPIEGLGCSEDLITPRHESACAG